MKKKLIYLGLENAERRDHGGGDNPSLSRPSDVH